MTGDLRDPVDCVDPLIDTAKPRIRWVFTVFTARPFGMVRLGPNTDPVGTWESGYRYTSERIANFSHVHSWQLSGVPVMPVAGKPTEDVSSRFSHDRETAQAGFYDVFLDDHNIRAELTATERVGFHRYAYPAGTDRFLVLDLGAELGPCEMSDAQTWQIDANTLAGFVENEATRRRNRRTRIHFTIRLNQPIDTFDVTEVDGRCARLVVGLGPATDEPLLMKVGLSYVSAEQAQRNLETELPDWDFDAAVSASRTVWNDWLGRIEVEGGSPARRTKFYTDLWRVLVGGHRICDVDGSWCDNTGPEPVRRQVPLDEAGQPRFLMVCGQDGFWHAQWSLSLLFGLAYPDLMSHNSNFLVTLGQTGGTIPRGPSAASYTWVMLGASSTPWLVAAWMKGIRTFDIEAAYQGMRRNALPGGLMSKAGYEFDSCEGGGVEYYIEAGWIPDGREIDVRAMHIDGAAQTLEYAYQDWCLAQLAAELGHEEDARLFSERARNYRHLFDSDTGFMRPRRPDGSWWTPFDPLSLDGWCEANSWQYTWHVTHDVADLAQLMGGRQAFVDKLDQGFQHSAAIDFYAPKPILARDQAHINYGNEPGRFVAHLFNHVGAPWLAQKWSRRVLDQTFSSVEPLGYCEDDDQGKAAATSALLALGLFDVRGGAARRPVYELTATCFDRITLHLHPDYYPGETFVIETSGSPGVYIQSARLNGAPLDRVWFYHDELVAGGRLELALGEEPNKDWGARPEDAPPSMTSDLQADDPATT